MIQPPTRRHYLILYGIAAHPVNLWGWRVLQRLGWSPMTDEPALSRKVLEDQARRLLELARQRSGASVEQMVQLLGELQPRKALTRRSWYDWQTRPETVSLLTGLAAIQMLGPEATNRVLFGDSAVARSGEDEEEGLDYLRNAFGSLVAEMAEMRERVEGVVLAELEKQGALMLQLLADMQDAGIASASTPQQLPEERDEPT